MNNRQMARAMLQQAEVILAEAHYLNTHRHWHLVIRRCQESVELALKAVLLWVGVEVPRIHDVGPVLLQEADRFPEFFQGQIPELAALSRTLRTERELSFYGDEQSGIPAADLYTPQDAEAILRATSQALTACRNLLAR